MEITYVNRGLRIEYGSNPCSYEHYLSRSENEAFFHYYVRCVYGCKDRQSDVCSLLVFSLTSYWLLRM